MARNGEHLEALTAKLGGHSSVVTEDAVAYVAAGLDRQAIDPAVWRELSAHELLDLVDVPRAGSFLPYSLSERLTACARRAGTGTANPTVPQVPAAEPKPAAAVEQVEQVGMTEILTAIQTELAALRQLIEALNAELRERLEAVHEEVLTASGVLDPGPFAQAGQPASTEPAQPPPRPRRARTAWIVALVLVGVAVVAGVLLVLYGWDDLRADVAGLLEAAL